MSSLSATDQAAFQSEVKAAMYALISEAGISGPPKSSVLFNACSMAVNV